MDRPTASRSALQNGNMQRTMDELKKLSDKLRGDELSAAEKEQLMKQLKQLGDELEKMLMPGRSWWTSNGSCRRRSTN